MIPSTIMITFTCLISLVTQLPIIRKFTDRRKIWNKLVSVYTKPVCMYASAEVVFMQNYFLCRFPTFTRGGLLARTHVCIASSPPLVKVRNKSSKMVTFNVGKALKVVFERKLKKVKSLW